MKRSYILTLVLGTVLVFGVVVLDMAVRPKPSVLVSSLEAKVTPEDLGKEADLVVYGQFVSKQGQWTDPYLGNGTIRRTDWLLQPEEVWKGTAPKPLLVGMLAEQQSGVVVEDADAPVEIGKKVLVYLTHVPEVNKWALYASRQGIFTRTEGQFRDKIGTTYSEARLKNTIARDDLTAVTPKNLAAASQLVLIGSLTKGPTTVLSNDDGTRTPYTDWTVVSSDVWKGLLPSDLLLRLRGGFDGGSWTPYDVKIDLDKPNTQVLMYLQRNSATGIWTLVSAQHGVFFRFDNRFVDPHGVEYTETELHTAVTAS